ncbi:MAG: bifunctional folylpolyglutamate synthase/dihydrofolate synthase [Thermoplasmata archaeon]
MTDLRYRDALAHLFGLRRFGMRPGLEVMRALLADLGNPERSFAALHVTGSKGKGSVSALAASALAASGTRVGLFTSPHLQSYRERMRVDGERIPVDAVVDGIATVQAATQRLLRSGTIDREPTFFEVTTALAFDWFRSAKVPWAVIEVGLGGRLDSTNVVHAPVGVITTIELEHTDILGPALADIAREKAGILHPGMRAVLGDLPDEAARVIDAHAREAGVPVWRLGEHLTIGPRTLAPHGQSFAVTTPARTLANVHLPLLGGFQATNTALAIGAVDAFLARVGGKLTDPALLRGLRATRWRGRLERVARRPEVYFDVAHTPESARAVAISLAEIAPFEDPSENAIVFGCLEGKRADAILDHLAPLATTVVLVPIRSDRSASVTDLRRAALGRFPRIVQAPSASDGLRLARAATSPGGFTLAIGSDYLVGELLNDIDGAPSDEPDLTDPLPRAASARGVAGG